MDTLIVVLVVLAAFAAILMLLAYNRGLFTLKSIPPEEKVRFVLMHTKVLVKDEVKKASAATAPQKIALDEPAGPSGNKI